MKSVYIASIVVIFLAFTGVVIDAAPKRGGSQKRPKRPYEYGMVTIDNFSTKAGIAPVVFDHWRHRSKFTCRLCHLDITFAMKAKGTKIKGLNNMKGYYCGSCHDGKMKFNDKIVFAACADDVTGEEAKRCEKCHLIEPNPNNESDFWAFSENLPKEKMGNGIDWEKAEEMGLIKPIDFLDGHSKKKKIRKIEEAFPLKSKNKSLPDILFSHKKHTVWNGCDVCHPEIFVGIKKGSTKYTMLEIFDARYCGVCHSSVAFPLMDCQRCHTKPV